MAAHPQHDFLKTASYLRYSALYNEYLRRYQFICQMPESGKRRLFIFGESHISKGCLLGEALWMYVLSVMNIRTLYQENSERRLDLMKTNLFLKHYNFWDFCTILHVVKFGDFLGFQIEAIDTQGLVHCARNNINPRFDEGVGIREQEMANYINQRPNIDAMVICGTDHVNGLCEKIDKNLFDICIIHRVNKETVNKSLHAAELYAPEELIEIIKSFKAYNTNPIPSESSWMNADIPPLTQTLLDLFPKPTPIKIIMTIMDYVFSQPPVPTSDQDAPSLQFAWQGYKVRDDQKCSENCDIAIENRPSASPTI